MTTPIHRNEKSIHIQLIKYQLLTAEEQHRGSNFLSEKSDGYFVSFHIASIGHSLILKKGKDIPVTGRGGP
jgi:hypothetical protein